MLGRGYASNYWINAVLIYEVATFQTISELVTNWSVCTFWIWSDKAISYLSDRNLDPICNHYEDSYDHKVPLLLQSNKDNDCNIQKKCTHHLIVESLEVCL